MSQDSTLQLAGLIKGNEAALVDELITAMRNKLMRFDKASESEIR
jgi:rsbT co-antagonist protein RsbR